MDSTKKCIYEKFIELLPKLKDEEPLNIQHIRSILCMIHPDKLSERQLNTFVACGQHNFVIIKAIALEVVKHINVIKSKLTTALPKDKYNFASLKTFIFETILHSIVIPVDVIPSPEIVVPASVVPASVVPASVVPASVVLAKNPKLVSKTPVRTSSKNIDPVGLVNYIFPKSTPKSLDYNSIKSNLIIYVGNNRKISNIQKISQIIDELTELTKRNTLAFKNPNMTKEEFHKLVTKVLDQKGGARSITINGITRVINTIDKQKCVKYKKEWLSIKEFTRRAMRKK